MKIFLAAAVIALVAGPALAQTQPQVPKAGESIGKSEKEIRDEREADTAYQKSLSNIPAQKAPDPWGTVRSDNAPKAVVRDAPARRAKASGAGN